MFEHITEETATRVLDVVDQGLSSGLGNRQPGQMCVEAAVCYALGEPHGDQPTCVSPVLRRFKIGLNDARWSSNEARAKGLRRIAIAQLGTTNTLDEQLFVRKLASVTITKVLPTVLRTVAALHQEPHKSKLLAAADRCETEGSADAARCAAAAAAAADQLLSEFAEAVVQILVEMNSPGSKFLFLTL